MPVHGWTRVSDGDFYDFRVSWVTHMKESLNEGVLPDGYYAQSEQHAGRTIADILTLKDRPASVDDRATSGVVVAEAPPQVSIKMVARVVLRICGLTTLSRSNCVEQCVPAGKYTQENHHFCNIVQ
jgi:hypothetical protein